MWHTLAHPRFPLTAGIVGGLGPHAHIWLERRLLDLSARRSAVAGDGDYPPWILVSLPHTPDRTQALLGDGPDPTPFLLDALTRLRAAGADFAAIACNTIHAFLPRLADRLPLPVINVICETVSRLGCDHADVRRVGLLATAGTCRFGLFADDLARRGIELICLNQSEQADLVSAAIYGRGGGGIKAGMIDTPDATGQTPRQLLRAAGELLAGRGAQAIIVACSEISLAVRPGDLPVPVIDTMDVLAETILDLSAGVRMLASLPPPGDWPTQF